MSVVRRLIADDDRRQRTGLLKRDPAVRVVFLATAESTNGAFTEVDVVGKAKGFITVGHVHLHHEFFGVLIMILAGTLAFVVPTTSAWHSVLAFLFGADALPSARASMRKSCGRLRPRRPAEPILRKSRR